jgi:antitoxin YefM
MTATYQVKPHELTLEFLKGIQRHFKDSPLKIIVEEMDETEYLFNSEVNAKHLQESLNEFKQGRGITFTSKEFNELVSNHKI